MPLQPACSVSHCGQPNGAQELDPCLELSQHGRGCLKLSRSVGTEPWARQRCRREPRAGPAGLSLPAAAPAPAKATSSSPAREVQAEGKEPKLLL